MRRGYILVEGQTEERFVKDVLRPHLWERGLDLAPTILETKLVLSGGSFRGGISTFGHVGRDLRKLLGSAGDEGLVTTMFDYYGLPADFPGMADRPAGSPLERVLHVEQRIHMAFGAPTNLRIFLTLHEFEALLFTSPSILAAAMQQPTALTALTAIRNGVATPEEINEHPATAPSRRITSVYSGYRKVLHGPNAANRIGLAAIAGACPHFGAFLTFLESRGSS